jgi:hypothetical protein
VSDERPVTHEFEVCPQCRAGKHHVTDSDLIVLKEMKILNPSSDLAAPLKAFRVSCMIVLVVPSNEDDRHVRTYVLGKPNDAVLWPPHVDVAGNYAYIGPGYLKRRDHIRERQMEVRKYPKSHSILPLAAIAI